MSAAILYNNSTNCVFDTPLPIVKWSVDALKEKYPYRRPPLPPSIR